ncbi:MAG: AMP-binding protein, partial [Pseudobdellovibrionaceae bacterium]
MHFEVDWLKKWSMYSPQNIALKDADTGRSFTYSQFFDFANRGASLLSEKYQISKGDRVAVFSTNEAEYVFLFYALQRLGAIMVPINFRLTEKEVDHIVRDSSPKLLLTQTALAPVIEKLQSRPSHVGLLTGPDSFGEQIEKMSSVPEVPFQGFPEDAVKILYTSGTTGSPKGAIVTHQMLFWNSMNTTLRLNISQNDCTVIFLPFFHTGGWNVLTTPFFHRGAKIVLLKKFDPDHVLKHSEDEGATILFGVPTTMDMMYRSPTFKDVSLKSIRYAIVGGEPMPVPLIKSWADKGIP